MQVHGTYSGLAELGSGSSSRGSFFNISLERIIRKSRTVSSWTRALEHEL